MLCHSLEECNDQISAYLNGQSTGYPLIVNVETYSEYQALMTAVGTNPNKELRFIRVSEFTYENGAPNLPRVLDQMMGQGCFVVSGIAQSMMLRGEQALDEQIGNLIGLSIRGHVVILLTHCEAYLKKYIKRDAYRLPRRVVLLPGEKTPLPQLSIAKTQDECYGPTVVGLQQLLARLEQITDQDVENTPEITIVTGFSPAFFQHSMYVVSESGGVFSVLTKQSPELRKIAEKQWGTNEEWTWLYQQMQESGSFSQVVYSHYGTLQAAPFLESVFKGTDAREKWFLWLTMRVLGVQSSPYLSLALSHSNESDSLIHHLYQDLLDIQREDERFEAFYQDRKGLLSKLNTDYSELRNYCSNTGRHGKLGVFYLTDASEDEEYTFLQILEAYDWSESDFKAAIEHSFPKLASYLEPFSFDIINTRLSEQDAPLRDLLTQYFQRYKLQKVMNRIEDDFLEQVNQLATERPCSFLKLQPRSAVVSALQSQNTQVFFFDALGVEYLSFLQKKCEEYGMIYEISIAHCELPSITSKNKEFQHRFEINTISDLDELKHHNPKYQYKSCRVPVHLFRELDIIERELHSIRARLIRNSLEKAVILSDHGASRLAVLYAQNHPANLELEENGQHGGRCCPTEEDPHIPQVIYEDGDGYAVSANYDRFKGGRIASVEVHGGATLEEVVVPIITLSLKPQNVLYSFVNDTVKYKIGKPVTIVLFCNVPMEQPKLEVEGRFYEGVFQTDKRHAVFSFDLKKSKQDGYHATVYEGAKNTGVTLTFHIVRGTKEKNLFG